MSWRMVVAPVLRRAALVAIGAALAALVESGWLGPRLAAVVEGILSASN